MRSVCAELQHKSLIALDTSIGVAILLKSTMLGRLIIAASTSTSRSVIAPGSARLAAQLTSLVRVDLAMGKLASADTTVRLAVLAETVVLCMAYVSDCCSG